MIKKLLISLIICLPLIGYAATVAQPMFLVTNETDKDTTWPEGAVVYVKNSMDMWVLKNSVFYQMNATTSLGSYGFASATPGTLLGVQGAGDIGSLTVEGSLKVGNLIATSSVSFPANSIDLFGNTTYNFGKQFYTFFNATNTTALLEGTNLYFTNARVDTEIPLYLGTSSYKGAIGATGYVKGNWDIEATSTASTFIATSTLEVRGYGGASLPDFQIVRGVIGIASNTPGTRFDVAGNGLFKGTLYVQATSTASSFNATSTLNVGTTSPTTGERFTVDGMSLLGGHLEFQGKPPTLTSCGTSPSIIGTDQNGTITIGSSAATGGSVCTVTFVNPWRIAPVCTTQVVNDYGRLIGAVNITTTAFNLKATNTPSSVSVMYQCSAFR